MRLVTFQHNHSTEPGLLLADSILPLKPAGFASLLDIIEQGKPALDKIAALAKSPGATIPLAGAKLLAPIARPPKLIFIGLNYRDHAEECGAKIPDVPTVFSKYNSSI